MLHFFPLEERFGSAREVGDVRAAEAWLPGRFDVAI